MKVTEAVLRHEIENAPDIKYEVSVVILVKASGNYARFKKIEMTTNEWGLRRLQVMINQGQIDHRTASGYSPTDRVAFTFLENGRILEELISFRITAKLAFKLL